MRSARVPPHSIDAEVSVLGAMLLSAESVNVALEKLHPEDFYKPSHQQIFEVAQNLFDANEPIDAVTVSEGLSRTGALDRIGGIEFLTNLVDAVPSTSNTEYYAGIVEEHSLRRKLMHVGGTIGQIATKTAEPIEDVVDQAEQAVFAVAERRVGDGLQEISDLLGSALEDAEERHRNGAEVTGVSTGFRDLDRKLAGLHPTNLIVVAARPGMGKSALAFNIAQNVALAGNTVGIFTLEMSREEVVTRLLCAKGRIDSQKLRTGKLTENDFTKLSNAAGALYKQNIHVDDSPGLTVTEIRAKCRRLQRKAGLDLVVIDYLQLMNGSGQENRQQEIAMISRSLKSLARELNVPIIAASQLNRGVEAREDKRPRLGDLRESGAVEQDADVVMFIYRDEYYHPEKLEAKGVAEVVIAKHRQGGVGKIDMTFLPEFTLFADMGRSESPM
ncbi:MAG: replicative DNA helicase [Acidimicrobiia bacterium]|nr:replicative DNA helicase [Acidimicrobiia bacterium]